MDKSNVIKWLLEMMKNCSNASYYNDPYRKEKCEALKIAIQLIEESKEFGSEFTDFNLNDVTDTKSLHDINFKTW